MINRIKALTRNLPKFLNPIILVLWCIAVSHLNAFLLDTSRSYQADIEY